VTLKFRLSLWTWVCVFLAAACGSDSSASGESIYQLEGTVVDELTNDALSDAQVEFLGDTLAYDDDTTSNDGAFSLSVTSDVKLGELRVSKDAYVTYNGSVYFDTPKRIVRIRLRKAAGS